MNREIDRQIGVRIRQRRLLAGLSMERMAAELGVCVPQFSNYETGATSVRAARLLEIATALGVPVAELYPAHDAEPIERPTELAALVRAYQRIERPPLQAEIVRLARVFAEPGEEAA